MSRLAAAAAPLLLLAASAGAVNMEEPGECPSGSHREMTDDPYQPLKCVKDGPRGSRLSEVAGPRGFKFRPKCPHGTRPAENPGGLEPYRCVPASAGPRAPELAPLRGEVAAAPEPEPVEPPRAAGRKAAEPPRSFRRYTVPGELSLEYPERFQPVDAWKDDTPMLSFTLDDGTPGKPVTLTLTLESPGQPAYAAMEDAIAKDKDWQGAKDAGEILVAGRKARVTSVEGESRTAYVPLGGGRYYTATYSAPADSFAAYRPAFDRLLKSLKLVGRAR